MTTATAERADTLLSDSVRDAVADLLATVARDIVMPRYRGLQSAEISEKSPGEIVTVADHESETALVEGLAGLLPGARIVGEEAASADPSLLDGIGEGLVWLIDPIDGTSNFASGKSYFGIMVALAHDGIVEAGWLHEPLTGRLCHAERGQGAFIDGEPVRTIPASGRAVASLATQFMSAEVRTGVERGFAEAFDLVPIPRCAAEHYPRLVLGANQVALFQRTLPWDHAAGALFLAEAGGHVARWDGSPYRLGDGKTGLIAASDEAIWDVARSVMKRIELPGGHIDPRIDRG